MKQSFCGVERHTTKMQLSEHGGRVWEEARPIPTSARSRRLHRAQLTRDMGRVNVGRVKYMCVCT